MVAGGMLRSLGLDLTRPFCCQTIRLDRWKDPHPVIDAFGLAKRELPELQLALGCTMQGDPGGDWSAVGELSDYAAGAPDLHLLTSFTGLGAVELNSLERVARLCHQRSLRGDADPDALEALWQRTPVVAAATDPRPAGVRDGETGYLVRDSEEAAARIVELVRDHALGI